MRNVSRYLKSLFSPLHMQDIDLAELLNALNDPATRGLWVHDVYQELRQINLDVDKALLSGSNRINDLSARRKAFRDVLEFILKAKNRKEKEKDPYPRFSEVDLDRVTV